MNESECDCGDGDGQAMHFLNFQISRRPLAEHGLAGWLFCWEDWERLFVEPSGTYTRMAAIAPLVLPEVG
jgi:hypothetical protein